MGRLRIDNLPLDRQGSGYARDDPSKGSMFSPGALKSVYEKRDVDPIAPFFKRRHGSKRLTNAIPNLLGVTANVNLGRVEVDHDFSALTAWTALGTIHTPLNHEVAYFPLFSFLGIHAYISYATDNVVTLRCYTSAGAVITNAIQALGDIDLVGTDYRFAVRYSGGDVSIATWPASDASGITFTANTAAALSGGSLTFIGGLLAAGDVSDGPKYSKVVLTNFMLYNVADFSTASELEALASTLTPAASGTNAAASAYILHYHEKFTEGGEVLGFDKTAGTASYIQSYLVPTPPTTHTQEGAAESEWLFFGGRGIIDIPFYLDFDEYYWTPITSASRLDWVFQLEITLPNVLDARCVFEFQDILRLDVVSSTGFKFRGTFSGNGVVTSGLPLVAGTTYEVFVGRSQETSNIRVVPSGGGNTDTAGTIDNPALFNYDKTLGFIIGDKVDLETSAPFGGAIRRIALHNEPAETNLKWLPLVEAVFYYDITSLLGDQIIDRGNRALNAYVGTRSPSAPPFYSSGGFVGGAYVAAVSGYTLSVSSPDTGYVGELRKALKKDAVIQRRGNKSFLTSNGVNYLIDDFSKTFRPLGIPRPGTKVSCTPQGVGVIDGFVRYAYRFVTRNGTVGPAFDIDPVDARGGVNVFLGADGFGLPGEAPFGISWGECEGTEEERGSTSNPRDSVESFVAHDTTGSDHNLLYKEKSLTIEVAARLPGIAQVKESVFSQGVEAKPSTTISYWMADQFPYINQWVGARATECCFQFAFRYSHDAGGVSASAHDDDSQCLFGVGAREQYYTTGFSQSHWRVNTLVVSVQPALDAANKTSIVVCRDLGTASRDNALSHWAFDYEFKDTHDYCVFVRRGGTLRGNGSGEDLIVSIYDNTDSAIGWSGWPTASGANAVEAVKESFWTPYYTTRSFGEQMWGASRHEGGWSGSNVKTRKRNALGNSSFHYGYLKPLVSNSVAATRGSGTVLYHARFWRRDFVFQVLAQKGLDRYGAQTQPLSDRLEIDLAFCPDSSVDVIDGGWDIINDERVPFFSDLAPFEARVVLTGSVDNSPILAYGYDMSRVSSGPPIVWTTTSLDSVPMWINWTSRNEGSISFGVGARPLTEIANKKWHEGSKVQTFGAFANVIDLKQWTWFTIYYHHLPRIGGTNPALDVYLERVFIDGNTSSGPDSWAEWFNAALPATIPNGMAKNDTLTGEPHRYGLFSLGGIPGLDQKYRVEIAEARMWDGERYIAAGGGFGNTTFGPYLSSRVPPNLWDKMWYYLRFMFADINDPENQSTMDQKGEFEDDGEHSQLNTDAVTLFQAAIVADTTTASEGTVYYIPFPDPPMAAIRGIQIFRSQVVPVTSEFPNGSANPNAIPEAWKACRDAPLYWLTEIPSGNESYMDTAPDTALGAQLDSETGLIPGDPKGVFEWGGYLGIYVGDRPRIHFAESPDSWESFPLHRVFDIPVREYGPIEAAVELASRDARRSRVLCLGKSWGVFIDGSPIAPQANTLGGGVGAASSRCLVVEKGIAYAYNGTLWAITGDGQVEDIGLPVLDLLPNPDSTRLSVSSTLSSIFVIDEDSGLTLRFHLARRQWFVEDRYALSVTDIDAVDTWVHLSGYPSAGDTTVFQDDVETDTPETGLKATNINLSANTFTVPDNTGLKVGQRGTLVGDGTGSGTANAANNPMHREAVVITDIAGTTITVESLSVATSFVDLAGVTQTLVYNFYSGVGYWGTMIDTGQFSMEGDTGYVDVGIERGTGWWAAFDASDFAKDPADRTGFFSPESQPTRVVDTEGGGTSTRWGLSNRQRIERLLIHSTQPTDGSGSPVGLTELELTYTADPQD